jgi:hypothetical protein
MHSAQSQWASWSAFLRQWGLESLAVWLLEAGGPLTLITSQVLYAGQPFIDSPQISALANLLEDHDQSQLFAAYIREDKIL